MTKTFSSDARGNLISITNCQLSIINYQFDNDNNMIGAEVNGTNWTFRYNANNQMYYSKIEIGSSTLDERFYIYDGLDCIAETDTDGTILREYIRIGNVGGVVAEIRHNDTTCGDYSSGTYYYHYNHRGDVIAVSDSAGNLIFKADYDAYGKITRIDSGIFDPRYTFSTKRYFKDLELYYYGYRWYLPELGRWTTKDPIGYFSSELNLYIFLRNNSAKFLDSYGLLVDAVFNRNCGAITVTDRDTGKSITASAFSGNNNPADEGIEDVGPIPAGKYEILAHHKDGWYRLDAKDEMRLNDVHDPTGRSSFRLHQGTISLGCITVPIDDPNWDAMRNILDTTERNQFMNKYGELWVK